MMSGKSVMEMVWGTILILCIVFIAGLALLCLWGMCSRDFLKFLIYAVIVMVLGVTLIKWCANALSEAKKTRQEAEITTQRNSEMSMYFESATYCGADGKTITIQVVPDEELVRLKKENEALKQRARLAEFASIEANFKLEAAAGRHRDECRQYRRMVDAAREEVKTKEKEYREQREIDHLERMELRAWRKTEEARRKRDARLLARVKKIRNKAKVKAALAASKDYAVAARTAWECDLPAHREEISNAVIALSEYLKPHNPTEALQAYLWDCRTAKTLLKDIRASVVRAAFGSEWEELLLSGLIGLNIITPHSLENTPKKKQRT